MKYLYNLLIYEPLLNFLIFFYQKIAFQDFGLAIILLTILVRIILFPISNKIQKQQLIFQKIQPEILKIQKKYKNNIQKQTQEIFNLYKVNKINPLSVYFLIFIQIPIFYALFKIFSQNLDQSIYNQHLYSFIDKPTHINIWFLGLINLTKPSIIIGILAAMLQYFQSKMIVNFFKTETPNNALKLFNLYGTPLILLIIIIYLPSAVGLYFLATNFISLISQFFINKSFVDKNISIVKKNELG